ncbi:MAG: FAD-dependent oxidoreductase [Chromatiales bacterium]|nr:FAD-dependent oxidoreductase [Chromatiales bacterium]
MKQNEIKRIGIVGSGIAGLSAAWLLKNRYEVTLYEQNAYVGGHTHTIEVLEGRNRIPIDTGFIVYNEPNYPLLTELLKYLDIETQNTDMSFAVSINSGSLEYAGDNLKKLFAQRQNLVDLQFLSMIKEILRFNNQCQKFVHHDDHSITLGEFLDLYGYNQQFRYDYLLPMAAAIWSCPTSTMLSFPFSSFAQFFRNHGLVELKNRPQWKTLVGGSWQYVKVMAGCLGNRIKTNQPVASVRRTANGVEIVTKAGHREAYDALIIASHADEAASLLEQPNPLEAELLSKFRYQDNTVYLHTDTELMPKLRNVWSSWNYIADDQHKTKERSVSVSYWMNRLQRLKTEKDYFVSLNPLQLPCEDQLIEKMVYQHPVFDRSAIWAQQRLNEIQGKERIWYCGSYFGYGFHEDALSSSIQVAESLGVRVPWSKESQAIALQPDMDQLASLARSTGV